MSRRPDPAVVRRFLGPTLSSYAYCRVLRGCRRRVSGRRLRSILRLAELTDAHPDVVGPAQALYWATGGDLGGES